MQYVIILNDDGTRKTSYPVDYTTAGLAAVRAQAEKENPDAQILVSAEDGALHHALSVERAYWDGEKVQIRPLPEPTASEIQARAKNELDTDYNAQRKVLADNLMSALLAGNDAAVAAIKQDGADLEEWYQEELANIGKE